MPRFDGTGPQGAGPMTGRGLGPCRGGFRRGFGCFLGRGGFGRFWSAKNEKEALAEEEKMLEEELAVIREEMKGYVLDLVEAIRKGLEDNDMVALDIERLRKAERTGPITTIKTRK